ncbi:hypothetical protein A2U01_0105940, partial [Trifolium medium]|nr:hypothetical protein [Trifolium medium]
MVPGAVLDGRQLSPGEVVARKSSAVASRLVGTFLPDLYRYLSPGETERQ